MTIEEKAKAYDEVRKKIAIRFGSNVADEIFSQFEMSEDERIRKAIINVFASHKDYEVFFGVSVKDILAWLEKQGKKGVKGNDREIPFDVWSEEDDEHLERILKELENQRQRPINITCLDKIESDYNWLKSIKNRYTWKPSDEQMDMLAKVCSTLHLTSGENEIMESIYDALKKLMEK